VSVDSSDVIICISIVSDGIYDRLCHHERSKSIVDSKVRLICRDEAQSAIEIVGWMAPPIKKSVVQAHRSGIVSIIDKSVGIHDRVLGLDSLGTKLQSW